MNIYLIYQNKMTNYDSYDSAVVCAEDEKHAKFIHPSKLISKWDGIGDDCWPDITHVNVQLVGRAHEGIKTGCVVCSSFNAG